VKKTQHNSHFGLKELCWSLDTFVRSMTNSK
jgi:hypothetical protein